MLPLDLKFENIDTNANTAIEAVDISGYGRVSMTIIGKTGSHTTHVVCLQKSPNGTDWFDEPNIVVTGEGEAHADCYSKYVRAKVVTIEDSTSTVDIYIQAEI